MNDQSSSTGIIIAVLVVVVILIVGWLGYKQGFFTGQKQDDTKGININLGGSPNTSGNTGN